MTDDQIADYNERFLDRKGPTDVLAFPLEQLEPGTPVPDSAEAPVSLGDVIIAPHYVVEQASEHDTTPEDEMRLMVAHGLLHLLGYDHVTDAEAEQMEGRERELLAKIGVERR